MIEKLKERIEEVFPLSGASFPREEASDLFLMLKKGLNSGEIRSAEPDGSGGWKTNSWVKQGILLGFRVGALADVSLDGFPFFDKENLPLRQISLSDNVRLVPGGSAIRDGAYVAPGVICMPPMYINIGAYVDEGSMVDSHALIGTCAQIGKGVHVSAAAQIGGVLEPVGANPVIIEDEVLVGGNCGIYEGTIVGRRAVLASGVILTASSKVYDLINEKILERRADNSPLIIPEGGVVVMGSRTIAGKFAAEYGLSLSTPVIVKYRDEKTDARTAMEEALR
ncbi:MAG: 2,3,4,5-tetrahydropyridine-2,6-dicarboxylate N-succinyltransferase [Chlorobi bacterium]|nr:2,3,4,5-tetrahydropyridine-2,6-dicarboxylate N-succinyltransferase [Chlorobiota bacterium]